VGIAEGRCQPPDGQRRRHRVKELVRYLLDNMYLDFRLLAKIIEEKGVDDLLITLADCLKEHIRAGISDDKVREQLQLYSDS
jgi:hypothetical protein